MEMGVPQEKHWNPVSPTTAAQHLSQSALLAPICFFTLVLPALCRSCVSNFFFLLLFLGGAVINLEENGKLWSQITLKGLFLSFLQRPSEISYSRFLSGGLIFLASVPTHLS